MSFDVATSPAPCLSFTLAPTHTCTRALRLLQVRRLSGEDAYAPYLQLRKVKDHFIFTIESTGAWRPHELFRYAVDLMRSKCDKVLEGLQAFPQ